MKFIVDYENVNRMGLYGSEFLNSTDELVIFYSDTCSKIERREMEKIFESGCELELFKLPTPGKNALDFCIASTVGEALGRGETRTIVIISNDKGYKAIQDYWQQRKPSVRVLCRPNIAQGIISASEPGERNKAVHRACDQVELGKEYEAYSWRKELEKLLVSRGEQAKELAGRLINMHEAKEIYHLLLKECGRKDGTEIYHLVKDFLTGEK